MKMIYWFLAAASLVACESQPELLNDIEPEPDTRRTLLTVEELPPMPPYPDARRGRLVALSAGDRDIRGTWEGRAGLCAEIGVLEIYAGPPGLGTAMLLRLPESSPLGIYPVIAADLVFPHPPTALIAVQVFDEPDAFGFQAYTGELELLEFGDEVSGRFKTTLREITVDMLTHFVGVFDDLPVDLLPSDYCAVVRDSLVVADTVTVSDSTDSGG